MKWTSPRVVGALSFTIALLAGWLSYAPAAAPGKAVVERTPTVRREREAASLSGEERQRVALRRLEKRVTQVAPPVKVTYEACVLEDRILFSRRSRSSGRRGFHGDYDVEYARKWAREAPQQMYAWLKNPGDDFKSEGKRFGAILFEVWAKNDPTQARAAVEGLTDPVVRRQALVSVLGVMSEKDPFGAKAEVLANASLLFGDGPMPVVESGYVTALARTVLGMPASPQRNRFLVAVLCDGSHDDSSSLDVRAEAAGKVWREAPAALQEELVAAGFACDADHQAEFPGLEALAREHAENSGSPAAAGKFLDSHGAAWAARDPDGALAWVAEQFKGFERIRRSSEMLGAAAKSDLPTVLAAWRRLPDDSYLKFRAAREISQETATADPEIERMLELGRKRWNSELSFER